MKRQIHLRVSLRDLFDVPTVSSFVVNCAKNDGVRAVA